MNSKRQTEFVIMIWLLWFHADQSTDLRQKWRITGGFRRRAVADLSEPPSLIAGEDEWLVAVVTGDDELVQVLVAHVNVARQRRRVSTADHCVETQRCTRSQRTTPHRHNTDVRCISCSRAMIEDWPRNQGQSLWALALASNAVASSTSENCDCQGPISTPLAEAARSARTGAERPDVQRGGGAHMIPVGMATSVWMIDVGECRYILCIQVGLGSYVLWRSDRCVVVYSFVFV